MAKLTLTDLTSLANETSVVTAINNNNAATEVALENTLSRDGTSPNEMEANLDMNGFRILNLPDAVAAQEPVTRAQLDEAVLGDYIPSDVLGTSLDVQGTGRKGLDDSGGMYIYEATTSHTSGQGLALRTQGVYNYTGGVVNNTNSVLRVNGIVSAGVADFIWPLTVVLDNSATAGENTAIYGQGNKMSTGPTWAGVFEAEDDTETANPTNGLYALELDVVANGTDNNNTRFGTQIVGWRHNQAGADVEIAYGIQITPSVLDDGHVSFKRGISFNGTNAFGIGIDLSGSSYSAAPILLGPTHPIKWGTTASEPMLVPVGATLRAKTADDSAFVELLAASPTSNESVITRGYMRSNTPWVVAAGTISSPQAVLDLAWGSSVSSTTLNNVEIWLDLLPSTDGANLQLLFSTDNGSSFVATGYNHSRLINPEGGTLISAGSGSDTSILICAGIGSGTAEGISGSLKLYNTNNTSGWTRCVFDGYAISSDATPTGYRIMSGGSQETAQDTTAVRLQFSSGNIASGRYTVVAVR